MRLGKTVPQGSNQFMKSPSRMGMFLVSVALASNSIFFFIWRSRRVSPPDSANSRSKTQEKRSGLSLSVIENVFFNLTQRTKHLNTTSFKPPRIDAGEGESDKLVRPQVKKNQRRLVFIHIHSSALSSSTSGSMRRNWARRTWLRFADPRRMEYRFFVVLKRSSHLKSKVNISFSSLCRSLQREQSHSNDLVVIFDTSADQQQQKQPLSQQKINIHQHGFLYAVHHFHLAEKFHFYLRTIDDAFLCLPTILAELSYRPALRPTEEGRAPVLWTKFWCGESVTSRPEEGFLVLSASIIQLLAFDWRGLWTKRKPTIAEGVPSLNSVEEITGEYPEPRIPALLPYHPARSFGLNIAFLLAPWNVTMLDDRKAVAGAQDAKSWVEDLRRDLKIDQKKGTAAGSLMATTASGGTVSGLAAKHTERTKRGDDEQKSESKLPTAYQLYQVSCRRRVAILKPGENPSIRNAIMTGLKNLMKSLPNSPQVTLQREDDIKNTGNLGEGAVRSQEGHEDSSDDDEDGSTDIAAAAVVAAAAAEAATLTEAALFTTDIVKAPPAPTRKQINTGRRSRLLLNTNMYYHSSVQDFGEGKRESPSSNKQYILLSDFHMRILYRTVQLGTTERAAVVDDDDDDDDDDISEGLNEGENRSERKEMRSILNAKAVSSEKILGGWNVHGELSSRRNVQRALRPPCSQNRFTNTNSRMLIHPFGAPHDSIVEGFVQAITRPSLIHQRQREPLTTIAFRSNAQRNPFLQKMNTNHFEDLEPSSKHASSEKGRRITQQQQWRQQRRQEEEKAQEKTFQLPPIAAGSTVADNEDRYDSTSLPVTRTHLLELLDAKNIASLTPAGVSRLIDRALFSRFGLKNVQGTLDERLELLSRLALREA